MCGIAGLVLDASTVITSDVGHCLSAPLHHRGPDDFGWCVMTPEGLQCGRTLDHQGECKAVLAHRRLSILDLTEAGWQPMTAVGGDQVIVHNGEIYNYLELRAQLQALGHRFHSQTDTEVLLKGYGEWGTQVLKHTVGMFAFAILDLPQRKLVLARDFFGIKPLYYTCWRDGFAFASEINPLLQLPGVSRRVNPQRLYHYLRSGLTDHGGETLFAGIQQLPAAHCLELSLDHPRRTHLKCFWEPSLEHRCDLSFREAAQQLRQLFLDSVRLHLRSDVPVGAALSGGIDSSSVVMAMRYHEPDQVIHTFSYLADDPALNEERWVDVIGRSGDTVGHKVALEPEQLADDLVRLVEVQGEPFASTSIYSQLRVFQAARTSGIKVMLDGQGADELLGGYEYYAGARLAALIRHGLWHDAVRLWHQASSIPRKNSLLQYLGRFLLPDAAQTGLRSLVGRELWPRWLNRTWFQERGVEEQTHAHRRGGLRETLHRTLCETSLPMLLRYEDRNSMACSIESRVPFLTPGLVDFVLSLPEEFIIAPNGTSKAIFREAMRGLVPDAILDRKDKIGFETPEKQWLCGSLQSWVERILDSEELVANPALHLPMLKRDWHAVVSGQRRYDSRVWRWVNLAVWSRLNGVIFD